MACELACDGCELYARERMNADGIPKEELGGCVPEGAGWPGGTQVEKTASRSARSRRGSTRVGRIAVE